MSWSCRGVVVNFEVIEVIDMQSDRYVFLLLQDPLGNAGRAGWQGIGVV